MITYASTTRDVTIRVRPVYLDAPTDALKKRFEFGCLILVRNDGDAGIRLLERKWTIRESDGSRQEMEADAQLGNPSILHPGDTHIFDDRCTLSTFVGEVDGSYLVQRSNGDRFRVPVPTFPLHAAAN